LTLGCRGLPVPPRGPPFDQRVDHRQHQQGADALEEEQRLRGVPTWL